MERSVEQLATMVGAIGTSSSKAGDLFNSDESTFFSYYCLSYKLVLLLSMAFISQSTCAPLTLRGDLLFGSLWAWTVSVVFCNVFHTQIQNSCIYEWASFHFPSYLPLALWLTQPPIGVSLNILLVLAFEPATLAGLLWLLEWARVSSCNPSITLPTRVLSGHTFPPAPPSSRPAPLAFSCPAHF